ncbi:MAG: hypothetical protein RL132_1494 [Pseudomonadota bacterium]
MLQRGSAYRVETVVKRADETYGLTLGRNLASWIHRSRANFSGSSSALRYPIRIIRSRWPGSSPPQAQLPS